MAAMERIPRSRQTSGSTRASVCVSSQRRVLDVRKHSPEIPESTFSKAPIAGAISPLRARHTTTSLVRKAIAVPLAPVKSRAVSATARRIASTGWWPLARASRRTVKRADAFVCWLGSKPAQGSETNAVRRGKLSSGEGGRGKWLISLDLKVSESRSKLARTNVAAKRVAESVPQRGADVNSKYGQTRAGRTICEGVCPGCILHPRPGISAPSRRYNGAEPAWGGLWTVFAFGRFF